MNRPLLRVGRPSGLRRTLILLLLAVLPVLVLLGPEGGGPVRAAGVSPFPSVQVLGWARDGALVTLTLTALGRGEVTFARNPAQVIPVKSGGLCGSAPRWSCKLELDPGHPEQVAEESIARVRSGLDLVAPVAGAPSAGGGRPVYPAPCDDAPGTGTGAGAGAGAGAAACSPWELELSDEASGYLPVLELVLRDRRGDLRYLLWQSTFGLNPDEPITVLWHPDRPRAAVLARSTDEPYPRVVLATEVDLAHPVQAEEQAIGALAAALAGRRGASVKLGAMVEEVRSRSQRRVELGSILADLLGDGCAGKGEIVPLEAASFDWSDSVRGAMLVWGCPADVGAARGKLDLRWSLHRRERGRWERMRTLPTVPGSDLQLQQLDVTQDVFPDYWIAEIPPPGKGEGTFELLGWRGDKVEPLLSEPLRGQCVAAEGGLGRIERVAIVDPEGKGVLAIRMDRWYFPKPTPGCSFTGPDWPAQREELIWRWNGRLKRFYLRHRTLQPADAVPIGKPDWKAPPAPTGPPPADGAPVPGKPAAAGATPEAATDVPGESPTDAPPSLRAPTPSVGETPAPAGTPDEGFR